MREDQVILGALLSEKSQQSMDNQIYTLKVALHSTKKQIKDSIKTIFDLDVVRVNTSILRGKIVRKARSKKGSPMMVKLSNMKKAYITLKSGQSLPLSLKAEKVADSAPNE